jgi:hypothetical protein
MVREYALYLQVGDKVYHKHFKRWGVGMVVEERRSELPGGFCYVRIEFQDGKVRVFDNNLKSDACCYYAGIERIDVVRRMFSTGGTRSSSPSMTARRKVLLKENK